MTKTNFSGERRAFMTGNEAVAWAAIAAGADIMYGYPITPQNQVMHNWAKIIPEYGRHFMQTEDEISAGFTTLGGVLAGKKAFTATAGPGNVIMQDAMSMAEAMRIPAVFIIQQRGGPSTGTVIYSQSELILTTHGGNGEGMRIVYSTCSHQELFDYTIKAFNIAWKYRFPTYILGDGYQGEMRESLTLYNPEERGIKMVEPEAYVRVRKPGEKVSHLRNCYNVEEELYEALTETIAAFDKTAEEIIEYKTKKTEDAELLIIAHGIISRAADEAVDMLREQGVKAGLFRPITVHPFPTEALRELAKKVKRILVVESAYGQLAGVVKQNLYGLTVPIDGLFKPGMGITSEEIALKAGKEVALCKL